MATKHLDIRQIDRIYVVFDTYDKPSIQEKEGNNIYQWRKFICSYCDKTNIIKLIAQFPNDVTKTHEY